jgi:hypothetical protein
MSGLPETIRQDGCSSALLQRSLPKAGIQGEQEKLLSGLWQGVRETAASSNLLLDQMPVGCVAPEENRNRNREKDSMTIDERIDRLVEHIAELHERRLSRLEGGAQ